MNILSKDFFESEFDDFDLEFMPEVKALLFNHIMWEWEGETESDNATLKSWLWYLHKQGRIHELITAAWVFSESRHQNDAEMAFGRTP